MVAMKKNGWFVCVIIAVLSALVMTLVLAWINVERTDASYFMTDLQDDLRNKKSLMVKLEVEREFLLSPHELGRMAKELDLHGPKANQIRWREDF